MGGVRPGREVGREARPGRSREALARCPEEIKAEVLREGFNAELGSFVQYYGADRLDASLLLIPLVGFLPATDERVVGTVRAIEQTCCDGFVERYRADVENVSVDGLPPGEGVFLPCSFWLVAVLAQQGRRDEAVALFERLLALGTIRRISEEYDPETGRLVGLPAGLHASCARRDGVHAFAESGNPLLRAQFGGDEAPSSCRITRV